MTTVILFTPNDASEEFTNVTDISINSASGVLTFYVWDNDQKGRKFQTTVPYTVREEVGGLG
jgi:hypothetical protein